MHAPDGLFCVPGNHDYWNDSGLIRAALSATGVRWLINDHHLIRHDGETLAIAGVDDPWEGRPDLDQALRRLAAETPVILLAHAPNFADAAVQHGQIVLQLSGHSHGGQVRIPGLGPLALPDQAWRYPIGLHYVQAKNHKPGQRGLWVYTNRGLGLAEIPFRLNCRPEVTILTLRAK